MSKKNQKKKKGQQEITPQSIIQQQKRQILEQSFAIKKLQDRLSRMTQQNYDIVTKRDNIQKKYQQKLDTQRVVIQNYENSLGKLNQKINELQQNKLELEKNIKKLDKNLNYLQQTRKKQMEDYKKLVSSQMNILQQKLKEYNNYMSERDNLYIERDSLKRTLQDQKNLSIRDLADKQRQKVEATDKLKDEMLMKIRDMRTNLLSLKKQQLSTTTRIAVLQNHQLTGQLQFQSKQTEKLIFENQSLQKKIVNLQKDLEVHKDVQEQLAKRSHMSKGIIKKLTQKIADLEEQLKRNKILTVTDQISQKKQQSYSQQMKKQEVISELQDKIAEKEKKFNKLNIDYQKIDSQNKTIKEKISVFQKKTYELLNILTKYYDQILEGKIQLKDNPDDQIVYDIKGIKKKNVQQWQTQQCKMVVNVLLNQIKSSLSKSNLGVPAINKSQILVVSDELIEKKLPKIQQHTLMRKQFKGVKQMPTNIGSKIVSSNLRQWGRTIHTKSVANLSRRYKVDK